MVSCALALFQRRFNQSFSKVIITQASAFSRMVIKTQSRLAVVFPDRRSGWKLALKSLTELLMVLFSLTSDIS